jgi:branched-chain amino acid transport system permease protein
MGVGSWSVGTLLLRTCADTISATSSSTELPLDQKTADRSVCVPQDFRDLNARVNRPPVLFFVTLLVNGILGGAIYALIALAFVVVYKSSRMINFAVGEWVMFGSLLVATGLHILALGLGAAIILASAVMIGLACVFGHLVLRRLTDRPLAAMIMITLGLGALMRGIAALVFTQVPGAIPLPMPAEPVMLYGVIVPVDKLIAACVAALCIATVSWFYRASRTGLALRAMADSRSLAGAMGINVQRHLTLTWGITGVIAVIAGVLWTFVAGGGISVVLVGLKIFPIVIIGGLDSIVGTIVGAMIIGIIESLTTGYLDAHLGGGFSTVAASLMLIVALMVRPYGLFGQAQDARV